MMVLIMALNQRQEDLQIGIANVGLLKEERRWKAGAPFDVLSQLRLGISKLGHGNALGTWPKLPRTGALQSMGRIANLDLILFGKLSLYARPQG